MKTTNKLFTLLIVLAFMLAVTLPVYAAQTDINGPTGSGAFGTLVTVLPNGNFVVTDPSYSIPGGTANVGAVYLYDGATLAIISTLIGSTANDAVGGGGTVLTNGNYVVQIPNWDNPSPAKVDVGAVIWCSATMGCGGTVSADNSLIGGTASDRVGSSVMALTNGNYVVISQLWDNPTGSIVNVGAATWGNGTGGTVGLVTSSNSLIGGTASDFVGNAGVTALTNGNYVVLSQSWDNPAGSVVNVGAATWGNGTGGTVGLVTSGNSLIGGTGNDQLGNAGVTALTNGNYVVSSPGWDNPSPANGDAGAATWGDGNGGTVGLITAGNSLIGGAASNQVGSGGVTALTNGNYVVRSSNWSNPTPLIVNAGAATWGNGTVGTVGLVTSSNSLIGGTASDQVGSSGVTALTNGNFVVASPNWDNPTGLIVNVGAATWGNGNGGTVGTVSSGNSLIGGTTSDQVGGVTALTNGNYVVRSPNWDNPTGLIVNVGAVTWGNGIGGTVGLVTSNNSLVGGTASDRVGESVLSPAGVTALTNGNYVVTSSNWNNPTGAIVDVGAVTWGNGTGGTVGLVTSSNSLVGGTAGDQLGDFGVTALTNGNYVARSSSWDNPAGPVSNVGAVTWGNGAGGTVGLVTSSNSLIGGTANDKVGCDLVVGGFTVLTNGNYVVRSTNWDNPTGAIVDVGAVTWGDGNGGTVGLVTSSNSLIGGTASDQVGSSGVTALTNSNYVVQSNNWDNPAGPVVNARAVTFGNRSGGTVGLITSANSILGTVASGINGFSFDALHNRLVVGRSASNIVSLFDCPFCTTTTTITSHTPDPSFVGQAVVVNFTVTSPGGTPTGNVTVSDGTVNCTATVAAGTCTLTPTSMGAKTLTATYAGDTYFFGSISSGVAHQVNANLFLPFIMR